MTRASSHSDDGSEASDGAPAPPRELSEFYAAPEHFTVLRAMNGSAPPISLRALAWFVANAIDDNHVRQDYESRLRELTRRRFDPFRRCERIRLYESSGGSVLTTIGQMNFFKWMIETGLWQFIADNRARVCAQVARSVGHPPRSKTASAVAAETAAAAVVSCGARSLGPIAPGFERVAKKVVVFD